MAPEPLGPGDPTRLGDYLLAGRLGTGGQGVVYEGYGPDGARVAVKTLHGDHSGAQRDLFVREIEAVRRVSQFCTARVLAVDLDHAPPYVVSEYVAGPTLQQAVEEDGPYKSDDLYRLAVGIATALTTVHRAGVVHRDLKPANVLLGPDGPRVIDFGIARTEDMEQSATGMKGTPRYMPPEVFRGKSPGPAVDIWAWGATVLFAASGRAPFGGETLPKLMHSVLNTEPDTSAVPERLRSMVEAALAKDPDRRPDAPGLLLGLLGGRPDADLLEQGEREARAVRMPKAAPPALGERAEAEMRSLDPAAQQAVPQILLRMAAAVDDLVRPAARAEFSDGRTPEPVIDAVLSAFTGAGLLTWDGQRFTLASPALLRAWPRLRDWAAAERPGLDVHQELAEGARLWDEHGRKAGDLLQGTRLERAMTWAVGGGRALRPNTLEQAFLDAGRAAVRRRSTARTAVSGVLAVLLLVTLVAGVLVFQQGRTVARQRDDAEARRLAAVAMAVRKSDPRTARRLAIAAGSLSDTKETREALVALRYQWESDVFMPPGVSATTRRQPSPNGRVLAVVDAGKASLWNIDTHAELHEFGMTGAGAVDLVVTDDARTMVTWADDGTARVWDTSSGKERGRLPIGRIGANATVFDGIDLSPSGHLLLAGDRDARTVWDLRTLRQVPLSWTRPKGGAEILAADAGDQIVAGVTPQGAVHVDQLAARTAIALPRLNRALKGRYVSAAKVSPDGSLLAVAHAPATGKETEILVWKLGADEPFARLGPAKTLSSLAFSQDGRYLAQARTLWRLQYGGANQSAPAQPVVRYAPSADCALVRFVENRALRCIEPATGQVSSLDISTFVSTQVVQGSGLFQQLAMSADASTMAYRSGAKVPFWDVRRKRAANGGFDLASDYEYSGNGNDLAISADGARLAIYKNARTVTVTDAGKYTKLGDVVLPHPADAIQAMALSPDGRGLALLVRRGTARELQFWDLKTFRQIRALPSSADSFVKRIVFRPDGKAVMTDGKSGLIEYPSGRVLARTDDTSLLTVLAMSRDGRTIVSAEGAETDQKVLLTDGRTLRSRGLVLRGHKSYVRAAALSPDGTLLATGDELGQVRLWEVESGRPYALPLTGHQTAIGALAFSEDGRTLTSAAEAGTVLTHDLAPALTKAALCQNTTGGLTEKEWRQALPALDYRPTCPR
ncbi:serine/threonine-protein kinase [Actinomadura sp. K4S16]|uniref:serine/threonine-protein kinase n=1 Tax=Actinomadura sp. K4S16 TaxID=1316147 RepID=UPI0011EC9F15|nr:serine/threonine-protein kinase [Actinomadura sp. K4S16]